ncbi:MAG TPA: homoserine kinase [Candidatus Limnocylindrales bacterium]|nr:homoserine kinase [Candidatus Limnocylindrales bacterium]
MSADLTVSVPGSSANLGPGYDVLALALDVRLKVTVAPLDGGQSTLHVEGEGADRLRLDDSNRFLAGLRAGARAAGKDEPPGVRIDMHNDIPLGRGLGSSAAASVAGLLVARELLGAPATPEDLLELATEIEGHPENAAASLYGGFVACAGVRVVRYEPPADLRAVVFIPERELATANMRAALPATVSHADAARNAGATAAIVGAFATGDLSLLGSMYDDRLHEPYRTRVYPELPAMVGAARAGGALGAALSGAGSTILALCLADAVDEVRGAMELEADRLQLVGVARQVGLA